MVIDSRPWVRMVMKPIPATEEVIMRSATWFSVLPLQGAQTDKEGLCEEIETSCANNDHCKALRIVRATIIDTHFWLIFS